MKRSYKRWLIGIVIVACALWAGSCATRMIADSSQTLVSEQILEDVTRLAQHGDWFVTRGVHHTDNFVATVTNAPLSHAAIYDAERGEVIEAEGVGIHTTPLAEFLAKSQRVLIIRPMWASDKNSAEAVARAREWVGKGYNFTGLVGLNMPDRYYCTQLVVAAYKPAWEGRPDNPVPPVIQPAQMYHWGKIIYDSGP